MENTILRKATADDFSQSWAAIAYAKKTMLEKGRHQWTDGYPTPEIINNDILSHNAYVLTIGDKVVVYGVVVLNGEPEYKNLKDGRWLSEKDYFVIHRMAVAEEFRGKGYAKAFINAVAGLARKNNVSSIKVDTNYDNVEMLSMLPKMGFERCGLIDYVTCGQRIAFEMLVK